MVAGLKIQDFFWWTHWIKIPSWVLTDPGDFLHPKVKIQIHLAYSSEEADVLLLVEYNKTCIHRKASWQIWIPPTRVYSVFDHQFCLFSEISQFPPDSTRHIARITRNAVFILFTISSVTSIGDFFPITKSSGNHQVSIFDFNLRWVFSASQEIPQNTSAAYPSLQLCPSSAPSTVRNLALASDSTLFFVSPHVGNSTLAPQRLAVSYACNPATRLQNSKLLQGWIDLRPSSRAGRFLT